MQSLYLAQPIGARFGSVVQAAQYGNLTNECYAAPIQPDSLYACGDNTAKNEGWTRPNGPAPQARQSRYSQWHLVRRPFWSRPLWRLSHLAAASEQLTRKLATLNTHWRTSHTNITVTCGGVA